MQYRTGSLAGVPFGDVHRCFCAAFADYVVSAVVVEESALLRRAEKNKWVPECSAGVWAGDELVAISLTGIDEVEGERRAYDICTGVVPDHRGRGLVGRIIDHMRPRLDEAAVEAMQLEVLQPNVAAIRAYEKAGFVVTRGLVSRAGPAKSVCAAGDHSFVEPVGLADLLPLSSQLDFEPSFEQRDAALKYLADELLLLGALFDDQLVAAVAFDPQTNWIMRLVTHRDHRRRGLARALIADLAHRLTPDTLIKAVNMDANDPGSVAVFDRCGIPESLKQWEMRLEL